MREGGTELPGLSGDGLPDPRAEPHEQLRAGMPEYSVHATSHEVAAGHSPRRGIQPVNDRFPTQVVVEARKRAISEPSVNNQAIETDDVVVGPPGPRA